MPQSTNAQDAPASAPAQPLASWYAQGMSDGLGDRLLMFDNSEAPSLELLRFHQELAQAPGFESALREQVRRLARFQHPAFARVRSVQRLEPDDDLALISNVTDGKRLSEVLHRARGPAAAAALIRQLAPALAQFQQHGDGNAHGLLDPNRIVVSPEGRLTIVEHAVGPAIEALALRHFQLAGMGIPLPPAPEGSSARLDAATDWYQLGLVALSVLIGRPVTPADVPEIDRLLDELEASSGTDQAALSPLLRQWLERALRISGERIETSADGQAALDELLQREQPRDTRRLEAQPEEAASSSPIEPARPLTAAELHRAAIERVLQAAAAAAAAAPQPAPAPEPRRQATRPVGEASTKTEVRRPPAPERSLSSQDMLSAFERESLVGRPPRAAPAFTAGAYAPAVPSPGSTPSA
jgi:ribosomal protein L12E/L44/L45/RPP1/RPP2